MADSDRAGDTPTVDDPEWIKGLVAEALIRASEGNDDVPANTPVATPLVVGRGLPDYETPRPLEEQVATPIHEPLSVADHTMVEAPVAQFDPPSDAVETLDFGVAPRLDDEVMVEEDATTEGFRSSDIRTVLEWLAVIVSALVVALVIKAFVLQAFWIPSGSMETTVNEGDRILVNKVSYRLHDVRRGDLVVFKRLPGAPGDTEDLIKRAIALPGETIELRDDGQLWIWKAGETADEALLLSEPYLDPQNKTLSPPSATDPLSTDIWDERCVNHPRTPGRCTLGEDQYFMMGDNRHFSSDSRVFGPVDHESIVGRAFLRIWPISELSTL